mmetsp:Transcript_32287/g.55268  ORF Transcript_32287/g.55268 Transcript_32287/m.55268 type:complete len:345 (+) Transcript_32287:133-1167(+)
MSDFLKRLIDIADVFEIVPYYAYRYPGMYPFDVDKIVVFGRIQEDRYQNPLSGELLQNLGDPDSQIRTLLHDATPDTKENISVKISIEGLEDEIVTTNEDGFYHKIFHVQKDFPYTVTEGTVSIEESCLGRFQKQDSLFRMFEIINSNPEDVKFAVISDVDDTILQSNVNERLRLLYNTLIVKTEDRIATPGTQEFYQDLHNGKNPFFYVSNSPAVLYPSIKKFVEEKNFPNGPVLLRNLDLEQLRNRNHKENTIEEIIGAYPFYKYILIGDSSEKDLRIYSEIVKKYESKVALVLIRDVGLADKASEAQNFINELNHQNVKFLIFKDYTEPRTICKELGFIDN